MTTPKVSAKDKKDFATCEKKIDQWIDQSVEAGNALVEIKKRKLYLISNPDATFESYVKERFGKTRQWAYDLINKVMVLAETGFDLPTSVAQPLKGLDSKTKQTVTKKAAANAKKEGRDLVKRTDIEAAIKSTPAARKQKPAYNVVMPNAPKSKPYTLRIWGQKLLMLSVIREYEEKHPNDIEVLNRQNKAKEPVEVKLAALGPFFTALGRSLEKADVIDLNMSGDIRKSKERSA